MAKNIKQKKNVSLASSVLKLKEQVIPSKQKPRSTPVKQKNKLQPKRRFVKNQSKNLTVEKFANLEHDSKGATYIPEKYIIKQKGKRSVSVGGISTGKKLQVFKDKRDKYFVRANDADKVLADEYRQSRRLTLSQRKKQEQAVNLRKDRLENLRRQEAEVNVQRLREKAVRNLIRKKGFKYVRKSDVQKAIRENRFSEQQIETEVFASYKKKESFKRLQRRREAEQFRPRIPQGQVRYVAVAMVNINNEIIPIRGHYRDTQELAVENIKESVEHYEDLYLEEEQPRRPYSFQMFVYNSDYPDGISTGQEIIVERAGDEFKQQSQKANVENPEDAEKPNMDLYSAQQYK
jgi:hypothetical protein